jgi:hypothetical protein
MRHLAIVGLFFLGGCATPVQEALDVSAARRQIIENRATMQRTRLQMCEERVKHCISCAKCEVAKAWHKKRWN